MRYIAIVVLVVALSCSFVSCSQSSQTDEIAEQQKDERKGIALAALACVGKK